MGLRTRIGDCLYISWLLDTTVDTLCTNEATTFHGCQPAHSRHCSHPPGFFLKQPAGCSQARWHDCETVKSCRPYEMAKNPRALFMHSSCVLVLIYEAPPPSPSAHVDCYLYVRQPSKRLFSLVDWVDGQRALKIPCSVSHPSLTNHRHLQSR